MSHTESTRDTNVLNEHATDKSVFKLIPQEVVYPKNAVEIIEIIKNNPQSIFSVRSGGTCMSGGSLIDGIIFNMTKYMNSVHIDADACTATVEGGSMLKPVMEEAHKLGLMFAPYPSSKDICGVGGVIGNNASGEKSIRFGATIDNVLGLEVILADGTILNTGILEKDNITQKQKDKSELLKNELLKLRSDAGDELKERIGKVPKSASGFRLDRISRSENEVDLTPIFVGAQGTLGIVTRAVLKLVPLPKSPKLIVVPVHILEELPLLLSTIMSYGPEAVETFDKNTFDKAQYLIPDDKKRCEQFFGQETQLIVLVELGEETPDATEIKTESLYNDLIDKKFGATRVTDTEIYTSIWNIRRNSFTLMKDYNPDGTHAVPCIEDIIIPISNFDVFIKGLLVIIAKHKIAYGFHGHIGDGSLRIIPIFDWSYGKIIVAEKIINFSKEVFALIKSLNGNISADHSDGIIRSPFLKEFYGERIFAIFEKVKKLFDPEQKFNPKKKTGGKFDQILKNLID
jgi:FAD/FMN-containing dehydrogenase